MTTPDYKRHRLSHEYGDMSPAMFELLQLSMAEGFDADEPVILFEGKILDGWHRYRAAKGLVPVPFKQFTGTVAEAKRLAKRKNIRRGLLVGQLIAKALAIDAYEPEPGSGRTDKEVAESLGVTPRSVGQFRAVQRNAIPDVVAAVSAGEVSLKRAVEVAKMPKDEQKDAIATPRDDTHKQPSKARVVKAKKPEVGASLEALEELKERNSILAEEHDRMDARLAVHFMEGTDEEKLRASALIAELQQQVTDLKVKLEAVTDSRDSLQIECNELKKQCGIYRDQLKKK